VDCPFLGELLRCMCTSFSFYEAET
jgi:hypothetical protein